jgi:asparagine synthase (glutamine-hydrolysing)
MLDYLDDLVHHQGDPIADWVCVPLYFISKLAKDNGVTVVQVGEGADKKICDYDSWMKHLKTYSSFWDPDTRYVPNFLHKLIGTIAQTCAPLE